MQKFTESHTTYKCWSLNSKTDFLGSKIQILEAVSLQLDPEQREELVQHSMENKPKREFNKGTTNECQQSKKNQPGIMKYPSCGKNKKLLPYTHGS